MFELVHAVIHSFSKEPQTNVINDEVKKEELLDSQMDSVISLVETLNSLLGKPGNNVVWGQFAEDGRQGRFPEATVQYLDNLEDSNEFLSLSHLALDELARQAREEFLATGGHVLVSLYKQNNIPFILIASIKQRDGLRLDDNLVPIGVSEIDLSKIHQAANINLNKLHQVKGEEHQDDGEVEVDRTYLCFISKGDKEASGYFVVALGCTKGIASARATRSAIDLVDSYFRANADLRPHRQRAKENVVAYLKRKLGEGEPAVLDEICRGAVQAIPADNAQDVQRHHEDLLGSLNDEENKVPDEFTVNAPALNQRVRIKGKATRWDVQFEKAALGDTPAADVWYDEENGKLVLSNVPEGLVRKINKEIRERD
ncbi:nucleoid-associated protein [uncultured Halomonas sp.]|uniref:nucleoid-associated protein n=1 Tax=uncultured Halomonas sp. TaxID=173971 RepID=UPI002610D661|nr:nucleoid-associated protein [uncultured Halomonas sp.]